MIEFEEKKTQKRKRKNPKTKGKGRPAAYHPSEAKSKVAKGRARDELGRILDKRQILIKIDYSFEEQRYRLEMKSGDGKIDESQDCGGIPRLSSTIDKAIKNWRGALT